MSLFSIVRRNAKLPRLMRRIGRTLGPDEMYLILRSGEPGDHDRALNELLDMICTDPDLSRVMRSHSTSRAQLEEIYHILIAAGAGQWVRGAYVAAAAIATIPTLAFVLESSAGRLPKGWNESDRWPGIVGRLLDYYEAGRVGSLHLATR